jgi:FkbM family methyltransferase
VIVQKAKRTLQSVLPASIQYWRDARYYRRYGEIELHLVPDLCRPGQDFLDIGANDGCYVEAARKHARRIHAFEPQPDFARYLTRRFRQAVTVHELALSREVGIATLRIPLIDDAVVAGCATLAPWASQQYPGYREITVATDLLDGVYDGEAGFIKIDVEGHEEAVLEGAGRTIARARPRILAEIDDRLAPGALQRITKSLAATGYRGFFVFQRSILPVDKFDKSVMQRAKDAPDPTATLKHRERFSSYVYNFLFLPQEEAPTLVETMEARLQRL